MIYRKKSSLYVFIAVLLFLMSCVSTGNYKENFSHNFRQDRTPWSHDRFDDDNGKFAFAIISDLFGGERPGVIEVALEQLELLRPELVLSVGDLIDGGTEDEVQLTNEWNRFDNKVSEINAPFFHVGGNHDLTNTTMREVWNDRYGERYYHFIYRNVLFLILDSEDYTEERMQEIYEARAIAIEILDGDNPSAAVKSEYFQMPERRTGEISQQQSAYFENVLEDYQQVRWTFLIMHKPVWMRDDKGGLSKIEEALGNRPYTVINGHFHNYSHTSKNERDYITLGTTGGSQNEESEMAFDHFTWITMTETGPLIANLKLGGILDKSGKIPADGENLCFQASECKKK